MKKLIIIIFLLSGICSQAQTINAEQIKKDNVTIRGNALHQLRVDTAYIATLFDLSSKVDSVKRKTATDSVFYYINGTPHFAFIDSTGGSAIHLGNSDLTNTSAKRTYNIDRDTLRFHNGQLFYFSVGDTNEVTSVAQGWADTSVVRLYAQDALGGSSLIHAHSNGRIQAVVTNFIELTVPNGLKILDGTEGVAGNVFTDQGDGTGAWAAPAGASVDTTNFWNIRGNASTVAGTNFLGSTDSVDIDIRTNNLIRARFTSESLHKSNDIDVGGLCIGCPDTMLRSWNGLTVWWNHNSDSSYNYLSGNLAGEAWYLGNTTATYRNNVAIGKETFRKAYKSFNTVAIGMEALYEDTNSQDNTGIGFNAMHSNQIGSFNVAIGSSTMLLNTTGQENTAVGYNALYTNSTTSDHVAVGAAALYNNTSGIQNTAVGSGALNANTTGGGNVAIGYASAQAVTTGARVTYVGHNSGTASTGSDNVGIGHEALTQSSGINNTAIGTKAGNTNTTGNYNIYIGYNAEPVSSGLSNAIAIGGEAIVGCSNCMSIGDSASTMKVGIATRVPLEALHVVGSGKFTASVKLTDSLVVTNKTINTTAGDGATINSSAGRFRKDTDGTTFTLTNSYITANSIIIITYASDPGITGYDNFVVAGAGSATITFTSSGVAAAPTANTDINFFVIN